MCVGCSDFVGMCWEGTCHNPQGGPHGKAAKFYLGDTFCQHLAEQYGTLNTHLYDHVLMDHDPEDYPFSDLRPRVLYECEDKCIAKGWYSLEDIERVSRKVYPGDGSKSEFESERF